MRNALLQNPRIAEEFIIEALGQMPNLKAQTHKSKLKARKEGGLH